MNWEHGFTVLSGVDVLRKSTVKAENKKGWHNSKIENRRNWIRKFLTVEIYFRGVNATSTGETLLRRRDNRSTKHKCMEDQLSLHLRFFLSSGSDIHTSKVNFYWYKSLFQFCFCSLRHDTPSRFQLYTFFKEKYCRWHSKYIFPVYHLEPLVLAY